MNDNGKTKQQLIKELVAMRQQVDQMEQTELDRKQEEEALKKNEELLRLITDNMSDMIRITNLQGVNLYQSPSHFKTLGYRPEERIGKAIFDIVHPDDLEQCIKTFSEGLTTKRSITAEYRIRHADGHYLWLEAVGDFLRDSQGIITGTILSSRDISKRKHAEEALRESEKNFRRSLDDSPLGARIVSETGETIYANQALLDFYGYKDIEELQSTHTKDRYTPESYEEYLARRKKRQRGEVVPSEYEVSIVRKDGTTRRLQAFRKEILWNGEPQFQVLCNDITTRKEAEDEKRSLQERLNRAEKMEVLGRMAGGVAHDLNNVLGVLTGYSDLLLIEIPEGQRAREYAEKIMQSTKKGAVIIQDLLTLARRGVTASEVIDLNSIVSGFIKTPVFENMKDYHPRVTFRIECQEALLNIKGSPVHLEKTLMNLLSNAAESISGKGEVAIRTENRYLDKPIRGYDEIRDGDYVILTVSDTGTGIPAENREKIFEPFYTKKTMSRSGTGLGLAIVWGTVKDHNGYIDVQSKAGEGTTFTLYFPVTREERIAPKTKKTIEQYMGKGESVLVVDDIAQQRDVASALLKKLGYEVHTASSGEEAVEYLKENKADILVLDMIMAPGIDGLETYQRVLEVNPKQRAILVSGFSETNRVRNAQKMGAGAYIKKPYVLETIGVAIRDELRR